MGTKSGTGVGVSEQEKHKGLGSKRRLKAEAMNRQQATALPQLVVVDGRR
jgi:hypothetical protein